MAYLQGHYSRDSYLSEKLPDYATIRFANQLRPEPSKILALFVGGRRYYFTTKAVFGPQILDDVLHSETEDKRLASQLAEYGISHLLIGTRLFEQHIAMSATERQKGEIQELLTKDSRLLFSKNGYALYELPSLERSASPTTSGKPSGDQDEKPEKD
jgi:hypothetical protein